MQSSWPSSSPEIEHYFFSIATVLGGSEIVFIALAALALLLLKLVRLVLEEFYDVRKAIEQRRSG